MVASWSEKKYLIIECQKFSKNHYFIELQFCNIVKRSFYSQNELNVYKKVSPIALSEFF